MSRKVKFSTRKQAKLPNASSLGYNQRTAKAGDTIVYNEDYKGGTYGHRHARVVGIITSHDYIEGESKNQYAGYLLVLGFSDDLSFGYERWVDPKEVVACKRPEHVRAFLTFAMNADPERMFKYISDDLETRQEASHLGVVI